MLTRILFLFSVFLSMTGAAQALCMKATLEGETPFNLTLEIAEKQEDREMGLMLRETMPQDHGMLFIFPEKGPWPFWMANTYIPLDIVPLLDDGTITEVLNGIPQNTELVWPQTPISRVLEVNAGLIEETGATHLTLQGQIPCPS